MAHAMNSRRLTPLSRPHRVSAPHVVRPRPQSSLLVRSEPIDGVSLRTIGSMDEPVALGTTDADSQDEYQVTGEDDVAYYLEDGEYTEDGEYVETDADMSEVIDLDSDNPYDLNDALGVINGEPDLEELLAEGGADLSLERVTRVFPFELDNFQKKSVEKLLEGYSVVVCAPTGAGKTAIAEAAAAATLARGMRVIYTTPLKALSNQKLLETRKRFGHDRCGLQTGDTSLNTEAAIVVMTTEILRNIMYRTAETVDENPESMSSTREARLGDVGLIVLDEVHYLGDPHRGSVWEEVIINCPRHIQLLCMSATVRNPDDLGNWISKEHQQCVTIKTRFRPVPLHWHFCYKNYKGTQFASLLNGDGSDLNPVLSNKRVMMEEARGAMLRNERQAVSGSYDMGPSTYRGRGQGADSYGGRGQGAESYGGRGQGASSYGGRGRGANSFGGKSSRGGSRNMDYDDFDNIFGESEDGKLSTAICKRRIPRVDTVSSLLARKEMLPAIWFIMSRKECDGLCLQAGKSSSLVVNEDELKEIMAEVDLLRAEAPESVREQLVEPLTKGIASHHAGHLPGWKSLVERLFQKGLLKLVFATGTLAAGINMPARTTLISALSRKTDDGFALMPHNDMLQMAGRAGRRGFDTQGHCVIVQNRFEGAEEANQIIQKGPEPLVSQFKVSYNLVLNLLSVYSQEEAKAFVARSFGSFMQTDGNLQKEAEIEKLEAKSVELMEQYKSSATTTVKDLNKEIKTERSKLRKLKASAISERVEKVLSMINKAGLPRKVVVNLAKSEGERPTLVPAVVVGDAPNDADSALWEGSRWEIGGYPPKEFSSPSSTEETGPAPGAESSKEDIGQHAMANVTSPRSESTMFLCLGADNRLMKVSAQHILGVLDGQEGSLDAENTEKVKSAILSVKANAWSKPTPGLDSCQVAPGGLSTAVVALKLQDKYEYSYVEIDPKMNDAIAKQREVVKKVLSQLEVQRKAQSRTNGNGVGIDKMVRAKRLLKKADHLRTEMGQQMETTWRSFTGVVEILVTTGAMEPETLRILPLGMAARSVMGNNELWLAVALTHPDLANLNGPQLAALLGALLSAEWLGSGKADNMTVWTAYSCSEEVVRVVESLEPTRMLLSELQTDAGLSRWNDALLVDLRLAGIVEAWAAGATWADIMQDTTMDDGDMARLLIRTNDLLRQVAYNNLFSYLKPAAMEALKGMDRSPIAELKI